MMKIVLTMMVFLSSSMLIMGLYGLIWNKKIILNNRLRYVRNMFPDMEENIFKEPFFDRVMRPVYLRVMKTVGNATPKAIREKYMNLIMTSGTAKKTTFTSVIATQIVAALALGGLTYVTYVYTNSEMKISIIIAVGLLGFLLPLYSLYSKAQIRIDKIRRTLPDLLDLLYISVEAGLGFDMALKKSAEKLKGPLSEELLKTMNEIAKGRGREDAFKSLVQRAGVDDLTSFVIAIIQTEQLGSSISNMLRIQSSSMRLKRKQRAEQRAAKIPIKMLFPLVFLMFPSLFVVILGPAVISIYENLVQGGF